MKMVAATALRSAGRTATMGFWRIGVLVWQLVLDLNEDTGRGTKRPRFDRFGCFGYCMATQFQHTLSSFADWILANDECPDTRLAFLDGVLQVVDGQRVVSGRHRSELVEELERWRYQLLAAPTTLETVKGRELVDVLDLAANEIAGRVGRPPRCPRRAIMDEASNSFSEALECLDSSNDMLQVAKLAAYLTAQNFGRDVEGERKRRMLLYAPVYLSSFCNNRCAYCGFRGPLTIERKCLQPQEAFREAEILRDRGFRHILLVAGDCPAVTTTEYYVKIVRELSRRGFSLAVEIAPQSTSVYAQIEEAGVNAVTLYQETYDEGLYGLYHPGGSKSLFDWRLEAMDRVAEAGIGRMGFGVLVGLAAPRRELLAMMRHADYVSRRFPDRTIAFSLPRIREAPEGFSIPFPVDDEMFVRMYCALRIAFPKAELVLSTRELSGLRDRLAGICITQLSAGSCTSPGGYAAQAGGCFADEQFPVVDDRSPDKIVKILRDSGFEVAWNIDR